MSYEKELIFGKQLALEAGKIMRQYFLSKHIGTEWKQDNTPVTIADKLINRLVIDKVKKAFPTHGVLGEEGSFKPERSTLWIVDPIDGTMPYSVGIPVSTFSLALVDRSDGQPVVAVVYDPQLDHLYTAVRRNGAFLNDDRLATSSATFFQNGYVSVIGGTGNKVFMPGVCIDMLRAESVKCFSFSSSVYTASKVAEGSFIGGIFGYGSPWDSAAVALLVEEAGGKVTDLTGKRRRFDEWGNGCVFACNEIILNKLLPVIKKASKG